MGLLAALFLAQRFVPRLPAALAVAAVDRIEILKDGEIKSPIVMVRQPPRQPPETGKPAPKVSPDAASGGSPAPSPA